MSRLRFHDLTIKRVVPEAGNAISVTFSIPEEAKERFDFEPGQFLTLRTKIQDEEVRRTYSICSPKSQYRNNNELSIGIRSVEDGLFSNWAIANLKEGDTLSVMPPDGLFTVKKERALHRVGFAAGSGITPILSIIATTLEEQPNSKFTLIYGNRRTNSVMFNEVLQDLKDIYADRLTLLHVLSRQAQETDLLEGRIDKEKVFQIVDALLPVGSLDEVFICGPEGMIDSVEGALKELGVDEQRIYTERFMTGASEHHTQNTVKNKIKAEPKAEKDIEVAVTLDGMVHEVMISGEEPILDALIAEGLDVPYSCKAGVCSTCRAKVTEGETEMEKNFTLDDAAVAEGHILSCQARVCGGSKRIVLSYDDR